VTNSTTPNATTYNQLLDRIIADGIAEVHEAYADPKNHHKRDGAIEGFEACRGKSPADLVALWSEAEKIATQLVREHRENSPEDGDVTDYWRQRYKALQIEWVLNVVSAGRRQPLVAHLPTLRGMQKYAQIVGYADIMSLPTAPAPPELV
jgi:hypothetical protein